MDLAGRPLEATGLSGGDEFHCSGDCLAQDRRPRRDRNPRVRPDEGGSVICDEVIWPVWMWPVWMLLTVSSMKQCVECMVTRPRWVAVPAASLVIVGEAGHSDGKTNMTAP